MPSKHTADTGLRLVFVHGAGENASSWDAQTEFFAHAEAINLPGHRANEYTDNEGRSSVDDYARWLHDYIRAEHNVDHQNKKVILVGHSMGGAIAQTYALMFGQEYLAGLVLVATGAKLKVLPQILKMVQEDYPAYIESSLKFGYTAEATEEMLQKSRAIKNSLQPQVAYGDFVACNNFDITAEMNKLPPIPTLIVCGMADQLTPTKFSHYLATNISGAKLTILDAVGHALPQEQPHEFNRILDEFISTLA